MKRATRSLGPLRAAARAVLLFERLWPAIWPALGVLGAFAAAALLGLVAMLPPLLHLALLAAVAALAAALLVRGLRRVAVPGPAESDRRLERASGLRHRPLAALADRPAGSAPDDPVWREHVARVAGSVGRLRVGWPHPGLAARDRRALRGLLLVALAAGGFVAGIDAPGRLAAALIPTLPAAAPSPALQVEAWVTPPATTGLPPTALPTTASATDVPAGSRLVVSLSGGSGGVPRLRLGEAEQPFRALGDGSFQATAELAASAQLSTSTQLSNSIRATVRRDGVEVAGWQLAAVPDPAPVIAWPASPGAAARGGRRDPAVAVRLPWQVTHPYGVVALQATLTLRPRPEATPLVVDVPLPGAATKAAKGVRTVDLTAHPWAGLPVTARLVGRDAAGLTGHSDDATFILPERRFQHPGAQAVVAVRKLLALDPEGHDTPLAVLDRLAHDDATWRDDLGGFLNLRLVMAQLARDPAAADAAQPQLWELALHLEEGAPARTAAGLARARDAVRRLLDAERHGQKTERAEVDRRMQALAQALAKHLQALTQQSRRNPADSPPPGSAAQQAQRTLEQMRDAARDGDMGAARSLQAQLDQALDTLQQQGADGATPAQRQQAQARRAGRQRGQQQMRALQDLVQREAGLLDHASGRAAPPQPPDPSSLPPGESFDPKGDPDSQAAQERAADGRTQQALRQSLGRLMQQFGALAGEVPRNLGDAGDAMDSVAKALGQGQDAAAAKAAQQAIAALQQGGKGMSRTLARQFGHGRAPGSDPGDGAGAGQGQGDGSGQANGIQPGDGTAFGEGDGSDGQGRPDGGTPGGQTDPFGRQLPGGLAGSDGGETQVPEQMEQARTRAIQDELRRRGGERTRPQPELDYIERLLQPF